MEQAHRGAGRSEGEVMGYRDYRVTVQYTFARKKGGVSLGLTVKAEDEEDAIDKAIAEHVAPYKARRFHAAKAERAR
ncbi:MAG: hypothetical protein KIT67_05625 [Alphaproteobacteria bacterium]|nr:hypothetical protein [Alphaproteobacteria bacterium]